MILKFAKQSVVLAVFSLLLLSCGQGGLNNPVGILGGGSNGYGNFIDFSGNGGSLPQNGENNENQLIGTWKSKDIGTGVFYYFTFSRNGRYKLEYEANGIQRTTIDLGRYEINDDTIIFHSETTGQTNQSTYSIEGNRLYLDNEEFIRV